MPKATVYIRNEDWDRWQEIGNKAQLIHDALHGLAPISDRGQHNPEFLEKEEEVKFQIAQDRRRVCRNGHIIPENSEKDKCQQPKCKYSVY